MVESRKSRGDRRYQVIPIETNKIDVKRLRQERDGIWSAAVHAYQNKEQWWLTDSEQKLSNENNQRFRVVDEWESAIANYLENREQISVTQIWQELFNFELGKIDRSSQMRVTNVLTSLNWEKVGQKQHQGKRQVVWCSPTPATPAESTIPWQSYPYQSKDIYTLRNRGEKVKERILSCATNNELISLLANNQASEAEINWLVSNLLTESERQQLATVQNTRQSNLFDSNDTESSEPNRELQIGARVIVKSRKAEGRVINKDVQSGLYEIAYLDSEKKVWEGSALKQREATLIKKSIFLKEIINKSLYKGIELKTNCFDFEKIQSILVHISKEKPPDFLGGQTGGFSFLLTIILLQLITRGRQNKR